MLAPLTRGGRRLQVSKPRAFPAPTGGWDAISAWADMPENRAIVLENWFPSTSDVRVRRGFRTHAYCGSAAAVNALLPYNGSTSATSKLFGAIGTKIYDVTSGGNSTASVTSLTNSEWRGVNFTVSGGHYLWICNGTDTCRHFDGTTWAAPSLTISGYSSQSVINVNVHKNRLWLVLKNSRDVAYLPTLSISGTATVFPLGGQFNKGGFVVAMGTWTRDGGSGQDDYAAFISSEGQVALYQGTDPASADTWALIGVYDLGAPIGYNCFTKVAGDLAIINVDGVLPLSRALSQDRGASAAIAITKNINNAMNDAARLYKDNFGWELTAYARGTMAILNVPISEGVLQHQYVMNTLTGAWCKFTGQNANCFVVFQDMLYFGGNDGRVYLADVGANDLDQPIDAVGQTAFGYYGSGQLKDFTMIQPAVTASSSTQPSVGISVDFKSDVNLSTPTSVAPTVAVYDDALYDDAVYFSGSETVANWTTVSGLGQAASIHFRARIGTLDEGLWDLGEWDNNNWSSASNAETIIRLNGFNVLFQPGAVF